MVYEEVKYYKVRHTIYREDGKILEEKNQSFRDGQAASKFCMAENQIKGHHAEIVDVQTKLKKSDIYGDYEVSV